MSGRASNEEGSIPTPAAAYLEDFDSAWSFIRDTYAYFHEKDVDWPRVRELLRPRVDDVGNHDDFVGLLEDLVEHLYDHHAHLGTNTASSPRLVPSGADLWAAHQDGIALITQVRTGSAAERLGVRAGMEVVYIDGRPVPEAVGERLPRGVDRLDPAARDWALRTLLAGRHNAPVRIEVRTGTAHRHVEFEPGVAERPDSPFTATLLDNRFGYVRLHNSLGQVALVSAWDTILRDLKDTDGLVLDLRDTPSGGDTIVARPFLGRLVSTVKPYQRHELPGSKRRFGLFRSWTARIAPRGPFTYDKQLAVLVGRWTGSMGEGVAVGLDGMQRATVFGSAMAGLRGATYSHTLEHTGIPVRVPAERLYHVDGTPREAFRPPFLVEESPPGEDAVLARALQWMRSQIANTSAL